MNQRKIDIWIQAVRPKTLVAAFVPVTLGACMVKGFAGLFSLVYLVILVTALSIQITCNLVNDLFDFRKGADTKDRTGPERVVAAGLISTDEIEKAIVISTTVAATLGLFLVYQGGMGILIIGLLSLIFAFAYTAGKFPLAYLGLGDIFVLIFFGPIAVGGTAHLMGGVVNTAVLLNGLAIGAISTAILVVNNIRDEAGDRLANKKTTVVRFGKFFAKWQYTSLLMLPVFTTAYLTMSFQAPGLTIFSVLYIVVARDTLRKVLTETEMNAALEETAKLLLIFGGLQCLGYFWAA